MSTQYTATEVVVGVTSQVLDEDKETIGLQIEVKAGRYSDRLKVVRTGKHVTGVEKSMHTHSALRTVRNAITVVDTTISSNSAGPNKSMQWMVVRIIKKNMMKNNEFYIESIHRHIMIGMIDSNLHAQF